MGVCKICGKEALTGFIVHSKCLNDRNAEPCTKNYEEHQKTISKLSVVSLIRVVENIDCLSDFINKDNEVLDDIGSMLEPFEKAILQLKTDNLCLHCGGNLYKSDLPQYDYVCPDCDENF